MTTPDPLDPAALASAVDVYERTAGRRETMIANAIRAYLLAIQPQAPADPDRAAASASAGIAGKPVGVAHPMPGASGFTMAAFKALDIPVGTKLYAAPALTGIEGER